ncbi:hypothetical protein C2G38_418093 [Gigaspora rosea]|uniref:Transmembrane protein n=1 Tax=Gigaspora rosea TaxID=44941 RepID=A0A397UBA8_9GLOM|nr:hypothetical protein C2G38_418093 [Gigaspora rosea]
MKTSYNLAALCLFFILLSFLIITVSTELNFTITSDTQPHIFTHSENKQNTTSQFYVKDIQFYDDGTTLIYLVRNSTENWFDHILRIRIIHLNGTVVEIDTDLNLSPASYCLFYGIRVEMVYPILIRPLKQPFILVSYMKQSSNFAENWGAVLNWEGEILSSILFEQYTDNITHRNFIQVNINKELGFLRISEGLEITATQYSVDFNGNLSKLLQNDPISLTYFFASLTTADEGYIILSGNNSLSQKALYAVFIDYNKASTSKSIHIDVPIDINTIINAVHCDAYFGFGYYCIASIANKKYYEFLFYTEKFIGSNKLQQLPKNINVFSTVSSTPIGGYIFSAVVDTTCFIYIYDVDHYFNNNSKVNMTYFNTIGISAYNIMKHNNTLYFSLQETNSKNTSWSLLAVQLPKFQNSMLIILIHK